MTNTAMEIFSYLKTLNKLFSSGEKKKKKKTVFNE